MGQVLSQTEIAQLQASDAFTQAYERAIRFLATRPRSIYEVRQKLRQKDVPPDLN